MVIGVDFDNTIVCYDSVFYQAALGMDLVLDGIMLCKTGVRDHLRQIGKEDAWTELQGRVYGYHIKYAPAFAGVKDFFCHCKRQNIPVHIISHKTRAPYIGCNYDLHETANKWLQAQGFYDSAIGLGAGNVYFEPTKEDKLDRIKQLKCTHFIDDLPEFLEDPDFPDRIYKILFDPDRTYQKNGNFQYRGSWHDIMKIFDSDYIGAI